ncbi:MAG: hypothetical protein WBF17_17215 [Phycisphaerae bacterium]
MKRDALSRYERASDGSILIDVAAPRVEDLYNDFDRSAPYVRRDLSQDLVDYLIDCARELGREPFVLRFTLAESPDDSRLSRIRKSVNACLLYFAERERQEILRMVRRSAVLFCIGLAILFVSVSVNQALGAERSVVANVFAQGLTVAAWVSLWEALAVLLIEWSPHRKDILLYQRLANARLVFRPQPAAMQTVTGAPQPDSPADRAQPPGSTCPP